MNIYTQIAIALALVSLMLCTTNLFVPSLLLTLLSAIGGYVVHKDR